MRDTIDLLESIGRDAGMRHASPEALARMLEAAHASPGLLELASTGDATILTNELGLVQMHVEHNTQTGGHEGDGHDDDHHHHDDDNGDDRKDDRKDDQAKPRPDDPRPA